MRAPRMVWVGLAGCAIVVGVVWGVGQLVRALPGSTVTAVSHRAPPAPPRTPATPAGAPYWNDPSLDPKVLERAYAPPSQPLPPQARPKPSAIYPPEKEWHRLQSRKDAVAY